MGIFEGLSQGDLHRDYLRVKKYSKNRNDIFKYVSHNKDFAKNAFTYPNILIRIQ